MPSLFDAFDNFFAAPTLRTGRALAAGNFVPSFDLSEREDGYYLAADLPGVDEADLEVTLHERRLRVAGKRDAEEKKEGENYHLYERRHGSFARLFALPEDADESAVEAKLEGGVLSVRIAKKEQAKPLKIKIG